MAVFGDDFTDSNGTGLSSHTPSGGSAVGGSSWTHQEGAYKVQSNRARAGATGDNYAYVSTTASTLEYTVDADFTIAADISLENYITAKGETGGNRQIRGGFYSSNVKLFVKWTGTALDFGTVAHGLSAGASGHLTLELVDAGGGDLTVSLYLTRASDGHYLKPDASYQSGAIACLSGLYDYSYFTGNGYTPPAIGRAGLAGFEFDDATKGVHYDNFTVTDAGDPPATEYEFTGPTTGAVNTASTNFTVTPDGDADGITVTPATDGAGSFTPSSVTFVGSAAQTFTYTPTSTSGSPHTLSVTDDGGLTDPSSIDYTVTVGDLVAGTLTLAQGDDNVVLSESATSGGTGTITRYLYRHTTTAFTPPGTGTLIDTTTSTGTKTWTDTTATQGVVYTYKPYCVDSAGSPDTAVGSGCLATRWLPHLKIGLIGDSNWASNSNLTGRIEQVLEAARGPRQVTITNRAISSTHAGNWQPGGGNYDDAEAAFDAAGVEWVWVCLATNDSDPADMTTMIAGLVSDGYKVVLFDGPYRRGYDNQYLLDYNADIAGRDNGTTVFYAGDATYRLSLGAEASGETDIIGGDNVHYADATASQRIGEAMAAAFDEVEFPNTGGGGGGVAVLGGEW